MTATHRRLAFALPLAVLAAAGCAPVATPAAAPAGAADLQVLAFADTASVRIQVQAAGAGLEGAPVRGEITDARTGARLWSGEIGRFAADGEGAALAEGTVRGVRPRLWSPQSPNLYHLAVRVGEGGPADTVRFGFRRFEARDGRLFLNGRPIFLRGNAINPPERMVPDSLHEDPRFIADYIRHLKASGVNVIRLTRHSQAWFDAADELGMMFYQGNYGTPEGGRPNSPPTRPFEESLAWYRDEVFEPLVNHPSVVIYVLSNEQAAPEISYMRSGHVEVDRFLTRVFDALKPWDGTRPYIGNAGYGFGRAGDICDMHRYWGWYYNSFLSYYGLRDPKICWRTDTPQPITLTESVGNYTGPDGRFNLVSASKQPDSQLNWTGHAPEAEQAERALAHQAFVAKQAIEITRRLRARNPHLAGIMPFSTIFHDWWGIGSFADMRPKPIVAQYAVSYQPVLLSWELWTPQVYAGSTLRPVAHVVNDSDAGEDLRGIALHYTLAGPDGRVRLEGTSPLPDAAYFEARSRPVEIRLPADLPTGSYTLAGRIVRGADTLSRNTTEVFVAERGWAGRAGTPGREVVVYDPAGATKRALAGLGVAFRDAGRPERLDPARHTLVIGTRAWDATLAGAKDRLRRFVAAGGRVLVLAQDPAAFDAEWLPASVRLQTEPLDHALYYPEGRPYRNGLAVNPERPGHPALAGIDRDRLFLWSDWTGWDESRPGFPGVYPVTQGFVVTDPADLARVAVLANYDHGLQGIALAELFDGRGSVLLSGFELTERAGLDPVADRLLLNLVRYQADRAPHHAHPLIDSRIVWGDYASERGLLTGIYSGLTLNTVPVVPPDIADRYPLRVDERGFHFAGAGGGWNTRPSIQYVPRGRRPFGPYHFSLGGSARLPKDAPPEGEGTFWLRVPAGRTEMLTTVWNPGGAAHELEIEVDGTKRRHAVPAGETVRLRTPLRPSRGAHAVTYRGDRRLVLLETDFAGGRPAAVRD